MKNCSVRILTNSEGHKSIYSAKGVFLEIPPRVVYSYEGDEVALTVKERELCMERKGETPLTICFCPAERTYARLQLGKTVGLIPLETSKYEVASAPEAIRIELIYRFQFETFSTEFQLKIFINFTEAK